MSLSFLWETWSDKNIDNDIIHASPGDHLARCPMHILAYILPLYSLLAGRDMFLGDLYRQLPLHRWMVLTGCYWIFNKRTKLAQFITFSPVFTVHVMECLHFYVCPCRLLCGCVFAGAVQVQVGQLGRKQIPNRA